MDCSNDIILAKRKKKKSSLKHSLEHTAYQEIISSESEGNNQGSVLEFWASKHQINTEKEINTNF